MIKFLFGFLGGAVYGILYMANEPNAIISNGATLIKAIISSILG